VDFHWHPVGSQTVVLGNGSEEDVLGVGMHQLILQVEISCFFYTLYAPGV